MLAHVAVHVGRATGADVADAPLRLLQWTGAAPDPGPPPLALARPELLGLVHEALLPADERRRGGAFFTPEPIAAAVVGACVPAASAGRRLQVCDPAVGGGAFLLAAARRLARRRADLPAVVATSVFGADVDPLAVAVAEAALAILGWDDGPPPGLSSHLVHGDALGVGTAGAPPVPWPALAPGGFDAVVGNPPFLSQLATATARAPGASRTLAARYGPAARGYSDTACLFLLLGLDIARTGGRVGMILPESVLAARDAGPTRHLAARRGALRWAWGGVGNEFDASVRVWAPVFEVGGAPADEVERAVGTTVTQAPARRVPPGAPGAPGAPRDERSWAWLFSDLAGVPDLRMETAGAVGALARPTADFRDQFYGLVPFVVDGPETVADERPAPRLVTSGLIDPAACRWGRRAARFAGRAYRWPRVRLDRLRRESALGPWARARLVPKVVLATQTRVIEAAVDIEGAWLPSVPTVTVAAAPERLWHLAAALTSPPVTALALREWGGTALAAGAVKLSARQAAVLPLPPRGRAWDEGAAAVRAAQEAAAGDDPATWRRELERAGEAMCRAYRVEEPDHLLRWWQDRLPSRGGATAT